MSDVQFEILKLLSEKDDLQRENEVLKHYRQSYIELMTENNHLRERIELFELSRTRKHLFNSSKNVGDTKLRPEPDGQEDSKTRRQEDTRTRRQEDIGYNKI